jgi:hypothetical protein
MAASDNEDSDYARQELIEYHKLIETLLIIYGPVSVINQPQIWVSGSRSEGKRSSTAVEDKKPKISH